MTDQIGPPAPNPCLSCPYRRDVPSGVWSAKEYAKLRLYDGPTGTQSVRAFQCHQTGPDSDVGRLCGGWVGCHGGEDLLAVRIAASVGHLTPEDARATMRYTTAVPLFGSGAEAAAHGMVDIQYPGAKARAMIEKIAAHRSDVVFG